MVAIMRVSPRAKEHSRAVKSRGFRGRFMAVSAVVLGFAFYFVNQFSAAMGSAEVVPPFVAAWLPAILTALAAITLLIYTEDG